MSEPIGRRQFLARIWKWGTGLIAAAGLWTSWDLLRPLPVVGFGGKIKAGSASAVSDTTPVTVNVARGYLVKVNGEVMALSWKCPHLGCRVPFCASSGWFECPCHGSKYDFAGDYESGPAPRGMDKYPVEVAADGTVTIDTSKVITGLPPGKKLINEPPKGPHCTSGGA